MCRSMADIQSTAAEIRRGKKRRKKLQGKNIMAPLLHRAAINRTECRPTAQNHQSLNTVSIKEWFNVIAFSVTDCQRHRSTSHSKQQRFRSSHVQTRAGLVLITARKSRNFIQTKLNRIFSVKLQCFKAKL